MNIKIFVATDDEFCFFDSKILVPVRILNGNCICCNSENDIFNNNLYFKYDKLFELNTIYSSWKNCQADYVGIMNFENHLIFNDTHFHNEGVDGSVAITNINPDYYSSIGLTDDFLAKKIIDYDYIVPRFCDLRKLGFQNTFLHYGLSRHHNIDDYIKTQRVLLKMYPEMGKYVKNYNDGYHAILSNMFVMRSDIFYDYCAWLFSILFAVENLIDYDLYSKQETKALAYIAERLLGIYTLYMMGKSDVRIHFLQRTRVINAPKRIKLPAPKSDENIQIALSFDDNYAPLASITMKSILENSNPSLHYDFYLFNKSITDETRQNVVTDLESHKNKTLNFVDISCEIESFNFVTHTHFTEETYYRFLLPRILPFLKKIIYVDCDIVCLGDISELFAIDISGYSLAGVRDAQVLGEFKCGFKDTYEYLKRVGMKNPYNYFQAGVLLLNLEKMRSTNFADIALSKVSEKFQYVDQDIFNIVCENDVLYIDYSWNVFFNHEGTRISKYIQHAPVHIYEAYMESRNHPKIIHFAGVKKPWQIPSMDFGHFFWDYARKSLWYETLLAQLSVYAIEQKILASQQKRNS